MDHAVHAAAQDELCESDIAYFGHAGWRHATAAVMLTIAGRRVY